MANATAAQAYTAVRALEAQMETTDAEGYHLKVDLQTAIDKIIADNVGVTTFDEAYVGIVVAASSLTDGFVQDDYDYGNFVMYKPDGGQATPEVGADTLFITNEGTYVTSLSDPA